MISRISLAGLLLAGLTLMTIRMTAASVAEVDLKAKLDHIIYATPNLQAGIDRLEQMLGVRATPGGQHPGQGTRNALIALSPTSYIEIIGPDPDQPKPAEPRRFRIDELTTPTLVTWAAKSDDLDRVVRDAAPNGVMLGAIINGSRKRPDGVVLSWRYTDPRTVIADRLVPFFIDWGTSPHPAQSAAKGVSLVSLRAEHPEPDRVRDLLEKLGFALPVARAAHAALIATVDSPKGRVELR